MADNLRLWVCGETRIFALDGLTREVLWEWDAATSADLSPEQRTWFEHLDEVKPVTIAGEASLLATASGRGGAMVVRQRDGKVTWVTKAPDAHSIELLPDGTLAVACSDPNDRLQLYAGNECCAELAFPHAHGLVWDTARQMLWASGARQLLLLDCAGGKLRVVEKHELPEPGAHDLVPDPLGGRLVFSVNAGVWTFDPASKAIAPFAPLARVPKVKSISIDPATRRLAFTKGEAGEWWSDTVYILSPEAHLAVYVRPRAKLYKVRWDLSQQLQPAPSR